MNRDARDPTGLIVVALGGNAMQHPGGDDSVASDFARTAETARALVGLVLSGPYRLVVTHGNGPQVGNHLLRSDLGRRYGDLPDLPLDVCVADTQGGMGYMLQQCLGNAFEEAGVPATVASLVTQVVVDRDDAAFSTPAKPVGETLDEEHAREFRSHGWAVTKDESRGGWRRVVASPDPTEIVEAGAVRALVDDGVVVVAAGGGGVPVTVRERGGVTGAPAVVDKDLASSLLAVDLGASSFVVLTDVERVMLGFGTDEERPIEEMSVAEARAHLAAGEFPAGSMGPKVEAVCRFVDGTGRSAVIAPIDRATSALDGATGTRIVP